MRLDDVWLRYRRRSSWVLRAVDVALGAGEVAVVLGRNGAGKSTLLQLAAGVLRPTRGAVRDRPRVVGWVPERFPADQPFRVDQYYGVLILVGGTVAAIVFGLRDSVLPWAVPPLMATARATTAGPSGVRVVELTGHAVLWSAAALALYAWLRRRRA